MCFIGLMKSVEFHWSKVDEPCFWTDDNEKQWTDAHVLLNELATKLESYLMKWDHWFDHWQ